MDLLSQKAIKKLLAEHQIFPSKKLGQNFLINKATFQKIIKAADLRPEDIILEIGPGIGNLTQELAKKVKKVIAVEKDQKMIKILTETTRNFKNIKIVQADILKIKRAQLPRANYKIVANLPYYIVSPVIRKFLETPRSPKEMILMVQKEVAQRIVARPPDMNLLAVSVQFYAVPKIISFVPRSSFWPSPKVDGAIIRMIPKKPLSRFNADLFFKIVKAGFSQPRKQILNNLSKVLKLDKEKAAAWLLKTNIQPSQRAETLKLEDWILLVKKFRFLL